MKSLGHGGALSAIVLVCAFAASARSSYAQTLPSGWSSIDIGTTGGRAASSNGTWIVSGAGANIWDAADAFQFTYRSISGDFDLTTRMSAFEGLSEWSKAGIMVRESLDANARNAYMMYSPGTGPALQYRSATGGITTRVVGSAAKVPIWLRLVRQGTRFTAYSSADGSAWATVGSATISLGSTAYIGMAVTSRQIGTLAEATFTNMTVATAVEEPGSAAWPSVDLGSPALAGAFSMTSGTFMITSAGWDIWEHSDQFHFAYQQVQGDVEIIARLSTFQAPDSWSKAGVMIRQSLAAGSPNAFAMMSGRNGYGFQRRLAVDGESFHNYGSANYAPGWVRLVREGDLFTAYESPDGSNWRLIESDTISMNGTIYVGLAVSSHAEEALATATLTNVVVRTPTASSNQPPSVTLTAPTSGAGYTAPATISLSASASDSDGSISRVDFYRGSTLVGSDTASPYTTTWSNVAAGTYSLTAVAVDNEGASATSGEVTVTVEGSNGAPTVSFLSPSQGATFTAPTTIVIEAAASDPDGISRVDLYQGTTLLKSDFTERYTVSWSSAVAGTYTFSAVARDNSGATRTATVTVTVNSSGNQSPAVSLTSPASGATYTSPATVNIAASASDADGTISRVEFYRDTTLISTDTSSPYTASWTSAPAGSYALTARAYDNNGAATTSTAVNVSIASPTNQLPTVAITSPVSGASFTALASITIAASASDPDGSISRVDFYVGPLLIASDTTSPYTASWTNVAAGSYNLTAVARDNTGATRTSSAVPVVVSLAATQPTTLVFTASADHSANVTSYTVAIYRSVDPVTGSPMATRDLGKPTPANGDISVDISTLVNPLAAGSYYGVVRAIGPGGTTASTPSASFTK